MTTTQSTEAQTQPTTIEYALMIDWEDGQPAEFIPATSVGHALQMARTIYQGRSCWCVGREVQPWRYAKPLGTELGAIAVRWTKAES